jgi:hypothetical protein
LIQIWKIPLFNDVWSTAQGVKNQAPSIVLKQVEINGKEYGGRKIAKNL